jgi:hypothetical protein
MKERPMTMQFTTHDNEFHITSHGNGWAYEITDQSTGESLWFQDEDAAIVQTDTADFTDTQALRGYFDVLCE